MISLILCAILALSLFSCADHSEKNPGGTQGSSPEKTTAPEQTTEAQSTVTPIAEAMRIEEGYVVTSEQTFNMIGEEKKQEITVTARVATLKGENGDHALYFDILNEYGAIDDFKIWKGRCQLHINNEGELYLFRINTKNVLTSGSAEASIYSVSDIVADQSGSEILDRAKIVKVPSSYDASLNFSLDRSAAIALYKSHFIEFFDKYDHLLTVAAEELTEEEKGKGYVYLIADSYSDAEKDVTYSPESKTPRIDLMINEVKDKFTVDHIIRLFSK
jgi:hypothetical protein